MNWFKKNWFIFMVWVSGFIFNGFGMWQASQVNVSMLSNRVEAIENAQKTDEELKRTVLPRFYVLEEQEKQTVDNIRDIKDSILRLEGKIDKMIDKQQEK